ncbi:MAG: carbohydrate kinase [Propionibacteriaceae bacterium]|jgi:sugar (pentulose or hexulose) kinase|nr:carbohydrate kinase [Propionibacteriaceae bacterium]
MGKYVIGIDSGTSVVKSVLFDLSGNELFVSARPTPVFEPKFGWSEFDLETDWVEVAAGLKALIAQAQIDPGEVVGIGITGKCGGCSFLDQDLKPFRHGILWNDARCADLMDEWIANGKMAAVFKETANWLMTANYGLMLPWLKANEPETLARSVHFVTSNMYIAYKLTGNLTANGSDYFGVVGGDSHVSLKALELCGVPEFYDRFVPQTEPQQPVGVVTAAAAEATGLKAGIPVTSVGWDVTGCAAGVGDIHDGQVNIILGTSGVTTMVLPNFPNGDPMLGSTSTCNVPGKWLQMIAPLTGTPNSDWFVNNFTYEDKVKAKEQGISVYQLFDQEVERVGPGSYGVIYHPYMNAAGERAPFTDTAARGNFFGLSTRANRYAMLRAVYEGMAFSNKHCVDEYALAPVDIRLSGGGAKSPVWCQIFADIFNLPVSLVSGTEYGAKGGAWMAALSAGCFASQEEAVASFCQVDKVYQPIPENVAVYQELYPVYTAIPYALMDAWHARSAALKRLGIEG